MCICIFELSNSKHFHFYCRDNIKTSQTPCNYNQKYLQYLTQMLSTIKLLFDQPGAARICIGELGMWGNNKTLFLDITFSSNYF